MVILLVLALLLVWFLFFRDKREAIQSNLDGKNYMVLDAPKSIQQQAADLLANINTFACDLIANMQRRYLLEGRRVNIAYTSGAEITNRLSERYRPEAVKENFPTDLRFTSYVLNKGEEIAFCLHPAGQPEVFHDFNLIQFVALHELSHIACPTDGHEDDYWRIFQFLLNEAVDAGLYTPQDYSKKPVQYCGITVSYNPYFGYSPVTPAHHPISSVFQALKRSVGAIGTSDSASMG